MFRRLVPSALVAVALVWLAGCGPAKLDVNKTLDLDGDETKAIDLPGQPKPQTLNVDYSSSEGPVYVYVFKEEDARGEDGLLNAPGNAKKALASKQGKGEAFTVDVPENTPARVIVRAMGKKTAVTMKVTNQK